MKIQNQVTCLIFILFFFISVKAQAQSQNGQPQSTTTSQQNPRSNINLLPSQEDSLANDEKLLLKSIEYPELQVVPRASERLNLEGQTERENFIPSYWPLQMSALASILAGIESKDQFKSDNPTDNEKKYNSFASNTAVSVGALWLVGTIYVGNKSSYAHAYNDLRKAYPGKDKKSELMRERLAEEFMERNARTAKLLSRLAFASNLAVSAGVVANSRTQTPDYAGLAVLMSFIPLLLDTQYEMVWDKHQEYKRKIYAPVSYIDIQRDPVTKTLTPLMGLAWAF